jgi:hypothetical protein
MKTNAGKGSNSVDNVRYGVHTVGFRGSRGAGVFGEKVLKQNAKDRERKMAESKTWVLVRRLL